MVRMNVALRCSVGAFLGFLLGGSQPISGQPTGTLLGTVVDEATGEPLRGATLSLADGSARAVTDETGVYELTPVPAGDLAVRVELSGYAAVVEQVEMLADEVGLFQFRLSRLELAIQGLLVRAERGADGGASESRVDRSDSQVARTALDLLREQLPGVAVRSRYGAGAGIRIRGASSLVNNDPALYVDGVLITDAGSVSAVHALEQIPAEHVLRIRVLRGPSAAARYGDANNGVILVEKR